MYRDEPHPCYPENRTGDGCYPENRRADGCYPENPPARHSVIERWLTEVLRDAQRRSGRRRRPAGR
jgi:hypothetical protein